LAVRLADALANLGDPVLQSGKILRRGIFRDAERAGQDIEFPLERRRSMG